MLYAYNPVICQFDKNLNFEVRIFAFVYFQLFKTSLKLRKREFDWSMFFVGPVGIIFSVQKKRTNIKNLKFCPISKSPDINSHVRHFRNS